MLISKDTTFIDYLILTIENKRWLDKDEYIRVVGCGGHPRADSRGYVFEHILIMEHYLGCYIQRPKEIHHIIPVKKGGTNNIKNLMLFPNHAEHARIHNTGNTYSRGKHKDTSKRRCHNCGTDKTRIEKPDKTHKTPRLKWYHLPDDKTNWYCDKCYRMNRLKRKKKK